MPYAISGNSVCQTTVQATLFGQTVMNVFYWRLDLAGGNLIDGSAFLPDFDNALQAGGGFVEKYVLCLPALVLNIKADHQWVDPDRFVKRSFVWGPIGGFTHIPTTANLSAVVELRGDIADKRSIGTKHIPGLGGTAVASGLVTVPLLNQLDDFGLEATLPVTVGTRTMTPIIFGRARAAYTNKHGVVVPAIGKSYRTITAYNVPTTARVMRRRTVGLGI